MAIRRTPPSSSITKSLFTALSSLSRSASATAPPLFPLISRAKFLSHSFTLTQTFHSSKSLHRLCNFYYPRDEEDRTPLQKYGSDLTELARLGKLDPVIGREDEIRHCIQILSRRTKNNPLIIGEPGVGKTAIAQGLAQCIVREDVPDSLLNRKLISLNMGSLLAGAKFCGDFEGRLKAVLKQVTESFGRIILFMDEIHTVVGAGATSRAMDAGNLLKPMLESGELLCIGATTLNKYTKYIEPDSILERRFQQVFCSEPSVVETISILRGLREHYELHHGVKISDSALVSAAILSDRCITKRFLPDKAIDLVDEAAAKLKMEITFKPTEIDEIDRAVLKLEVEKLALKNDTTDKASKERLSKLESDLSLLKQKQKELADHWDNEKALISQIRSLKKEIDCEIRRQKLKILRYDDGPTLTSLEHQLEEAEKNLADLRKCRPSLLREEVTDVDIVNLSPLKGGAYPIPKLAMFELMRQNKAE